MGPLVRVPVLLLPDESEAVVPEVSSNFQWPARPVVISWAWISLAGTKRLTLKIKAAIIYIIIQEIALSCD